MKSKTKFPPLDGTFRKSSHSQPGFPKVTCVEVAKRRGKVLVRNSNNPGAGTALFTSAEWKAFIAGAKGGEFEV